MRPSIEAEEHRWLIDPMQKDRLNAVGILDADREGVVDRIGELRERMVFQEPQHTDEGPGAVPVIGFQPSAEQTEALRQGPLLQRSGKIEAARFAFEQRQIMHGIKEGPFSLPTPRVAGHESPSTTRPREAVMSTPTADGTT